MNIHTYIHATVKDKVYTIRSEFDPAGACFCASSVSDYHLNAFLELVGFLYRFTIERDCSALFIEDEWRHHIGLQFIDSHAYRSGVLANGF